MVAGNDYRSGRKQLNVVLSKVLHGQVRSSAASAGVSMSEWVSEAVREKVMRDVDGTGGRSGPRSGFAAVADVGGPRPVASSGGEGSARVGAGDVVDEVIGFDAFIDELMESRDRHPSGPRLRVVGEEWEPA